MRRVRTIAVSVLFLVSALSLSYEKARATGVYEDAVAQAGFLTARHNSAVRSRLIVVDAETTEGSLIVLDVDFAIRGFLLLEFEQPFVTAAVDGREIESDMGDLRVKARFRLFGRPGKQLSLLFDIGMGTGSADVFPFSSGSLETAGAIGWVDTIGVFQYWAMAGAQSVRRRPDNIESEFGVVDFARANAGIAVAARDFSLRLGTSVLRFSESTVRDIYFGEVTWDYREYFRFFGATQVEAGRSDERISNASAHIGMSVYF